MADPPPPHPHQGIWLWMAGAWMLIGGGVVSGYLVRAKRFDVTSPLMLGRVHLRGSGRRLRHWSRPGLAIPVHETASRGDP
jgi:hypothetical protein